MRWVLMLFVILAAVMGGEARAVVVTGRAVVSERDGRAAEKAAEALRVESERKFLEVEEAAGLEGAGPLALWFPGGFAVARSDGLSGTGTTGCRRVSSTSWRYDLADNRVARTETEERRAANSTSWVRTAAADQRCLYRNAAGTGPNGRNQLSQSWETRTRWDAVSGAPLELSEQTVSYRYDPRGNRTRRTTRLWKQARATGSAAWPVPAVTDTDEALEWDGENRLTGMWRGPWREELAQVPFESLVGEAVAGSTVWRWGYDHRSRRVQRDEPGSGGARLRTVTVFSGGTSAAEYTETTAAGSAWTVPSAPTVQHVRGPDLGGGTKGLLYSLRNGLPTFNRYNGRGDVVAQSDIDGTTTWAASYQADGRRTAEAGTNVERHRACTKEEDPTGLLNEGFRYRDMETGTFISRDPLGLVDGPNVYCYVRQNPWTMWDPLGLAEIIQWQHNIPKGPNEAARLLADKSGINVNDKRWGRMVLASDHQPILHSTGGGTYKEYRRTMNDWAEKWQAANPGKKATEADFEAGIKAAYDDNPNFKAVWERSAPAELDYSQPTNGETLERGTKTWRNAGVTTEQKQANARALLQEHANVEGGIKKFSGSRIAGGVVLGAAALWASTYTGKAGEEHMAEMASAFKAAHDTWKAGVSISDVDMIILTEHLQSLSPFSNDITFLNNFAKLEEWNREATSSNSKWFLPH
jgi:RHS repeat-associated protein